MSPDALVARLDDPTLRLIEISWADDDSGYRRAHIPGASWAYWKDLLWDDTAREFATPRQLADRLGALGIPDTATVVLYGDPVQFGTYALWTFILAGLESAVLLDGGKEYWIKAGLPVATGAPHAQACRRVLVGNPDGASRVGRDEVRAALADPNVAILDLRAPEEYSGERVSPWGMAVDYGAERAGRIPGARHLYFRDLLEPDGRFLSADQLRARFADAGVAPADKVIVYCRLSHRATLGWFALTQLVGATDVRIYDGSWTEWGSMVGMPIER
jgi:thiosulfate/3-mercaptopyruvate sulfurtransferase